MRTKKQNENVCESKQQIDTYKETRKTKKLKKKSVRRKHILSKPFIVQTFSFTIRTVLSPVRILGNSTTC